MKMKFRMTFILTIVCLNAAFVFGQEKALEKDAFDSAVNGAQKKLAKQAYRRTNVYEMFDDRDSEPTKSSKTVTEIALSGAIRWLVESDGKKYEMILVDGKRYKKEDGGPWKLDESAGGYGRGCGAETKDLSYKVKEKSDLNGKKANLYESVQKMLGISCGKESADELWTERYWIGEDGTLLKSESIFEDIGKKSMRRDVSVYEYDPNIKIEAPVK